MNRPQPPRTRVALALSLVLLILAVGVTLSRSPALVIRSNSVPAAVEFASVTGHFAGCQANEVLPRLTTAIRLSLYSVLGPRVAVRALSGKRLLTRGERSAGWTAADVTVPVKPVTQTTTGVAICFEFLAKDESVGLTGQRVQAAGARPGGGLLKIEYLAPGKQSWWSLLSTVAAHVAFGHAWNGFWVVPFLAAIMGAIAMIVAWSATRLTR